MIVIPLNSSLLKYNIIVNFASLMFLILPKGSENQHLHVKSVQANIFSENNNFTIVEYSYLIHVSVLWERVV